jgi:hypothetical protein
VGGRWWAGVFVFWGPQNGWLGGREEAGFVFGGAAEGVLVIGDFAALEVEVVLYFAVCRELPAGAVVGALGVGGVACDFGERVAVVCGAAVNHCLGHLVFGIGTGLGTEEHLIHEGGFDAAQAVEPPLGFGHLLDEECFVRAGRGEVLLEIGDELKEGGLVLMREDDAGGGESVGGGVLAGDGLALGCARPVWPVWVNAGDAIGGPFGLTIADDVKKSDRGLGGIGCKLLVWWEKIFRRFL